MNRVLVLGNGLIGKTITECLRQDFHVINLDPMNRAESKNGVDYHDGRLDEKFSKTHAQTLCGAINCSYPVHNDISSKTDAASIAENVATHIENAITFLRFFDEVDTQKDSPKFLVQFSSIYSHCIPRAEIYQGTQRGVPDDYIAAKSAINQLVRVYAKKNKCRNIYINAIAPGGVFNNHEEQFVRSYGNNTISGGMLSSVNLTGVVKLLTNPLLNPMTGQIVHIDDGFSL